MSQARKIAMAPGQKMRKPRHKSIMRGTLVAACSGAAQTFRKLGIKTAWDPASQTGNAFDSDENKDVLKGKARKDAREGIQKEKVRS